MFTVKIYEAGQWQTNSHHTSISDGQERLRWLMRTSSPARRPKFAALFDQRGKAIKSEFSRKPETIAKY